MCGSVSFLSAYLSLIQYYVVLIVMLCIRSDSWYLGWLSPILINSPSWFLENLLYSITYFYCVYIYIYILIYNNPPLNAHLYTGHLVSFQLSLSCSNTAISFSVDIFWWAYVCLVIARVPKSMLDNAFPPFYYIILVYQSLVPIYTNNSMRL